jgi:hypothetical protein
MTPTLRDIQRLLVQYGPLWTNGKTHIVVSEASMFTEGRSWSTIPGRPTPGRSNGGRTRVGTSETSMRNRTIQIAPGTPETMWKPSFSITRRNRRLMIFAVALSALTTFLACAKPGDAKMKSSLPHIEIVPGKAIGEVRLGASANELPRRAIVNAPGGELDGIRFLLNSGSRVEDIWIEDLRKFRKALSCGGKTIDKKATVSQLEEVFGECTRVEGVKGGIFYCAAGVALGTDFAGKTLQIRVKPR